MGIFFVLVEKHELYSSDLTSNQFEDHFLANLLSTELFSMPDTSTPDWDRAYHLISFHLDIFSPLLSDITTTTIMFSSLVGGVFAFFLIVSSMDEKIVEIDLSSHFDVQLVYQNLSSHS